ncbi:MAG: hypothetical protein KBC48_00715 [Candidatus Pacebacteria bacterium]|nr:hypothetical protein [Candidatus Paceibacterota bacterium]
MKKFFKFLAKGAIILLFIGLFAFTLSSEEMRNRVAGYITEFFYGDTVAGMAYDVDGHPVFFSDGSKGAGLFLQMARIPEDLNQVMKEADGNLWKGQVLRLTCSKDMKSILRIRIVNDRSGFYTKPEAPLPPEEEENGLMAEVMEDYRPLDQRFPEGANVEEAIDSFLSFHENLTLAKAN